MYKTSFTTLFDNNLRDVDSKWHTMLIKSRQTAKWIQFCYFKTNIQINIVLFHLGENNPRKLFQRNKKTKQSDPWNAIEEKQMWCFRQIPNQTRDVVFLTSVLHNKQMKRKDGMYCDTRGRCDH